MHETNDSDQISSICCENPATSAHTRRCLASSTYEPHKMRPPAMDTLSAPGQSCDGTRGFGRLKEGFGGGPIWLTGYNPKAQCCAELDWLVPEYIGYTLLLELIQHGLGTGITAPNHRVGKRR